MNASYGEINGILECVERGDAALTVPEFNFWNDSFHRRSAAATHNRLVIAFMKASALPAKRQAMSDLSAREGPREALPGLACLWNATAEPGDAYPALAGSVSADVAVVGGGYTGLSAALHLAEGKATVVVLEAREAGWGASGRNGGQVIAGLKYDPPELLEKFGPDLGPRLIEFVGGAPDLVFHLIERHGIACDARRCGWIQPAHTPSMASLLRRRAESWAERGAEVEILDRARTAELIGSSTYVSAWLDKRGGSLNPLSYARGLARAADRAGARIFAQTPVGALTRIGNGFALQTPKGRLVARQVILATNGYTGDLWPGLRQTIIPTHSFQVATAPLSDDVRRTILPYGHVLSDSRRLLLYFRVDPTGRLVMGGVGTVGEPHGRDAFRHLYRAVRHVFPQVEAPYEFHWYGRVAITPDFFPHLHEPVPGLLSAIGYNGRGIAMATAMGSVLARRALGEAPQALPFPITRLRPISFHSLRNLYVGAVRTYYRLRDIAS